MGFPIVGHPVFYYEQKYFLIKLPRKIRLGIFLAAFPLIEIAVRISNSNISFLGLGLFRSLFAEAALGCLLFLVTFLIRNKKVARGIAIGVFIFFAVYSMIQACSMAKFGLYFQISYMFKMAGNAATNFMGDIIELFFKHLWLLVIASIPGVFFILFRKAIIPDEFRSIKKSRKQRARKQKYTIRYAVYFAALLLVSIILCYVGGDHNYYTYDYTSTNAVPRFGLINSLRLELEYGVFGVPKKIL